MSKFLVQVDSIMDATQTAAVLNFGSTGVKEFMQAYLDLIGQIDGGLMDASVNVKLGTDYASMTGTFSGAPTADETLTIAGVAFTAKDSGATGNQFNIGGSVTATAANAAAAINASSTAGISGCVVASSNLGVLTIRAAIPGKIGNAITLAESMSNFGWTGGATRLANGDQDTNVSYNLGYTAES